jgi:hypothetical protein
MRIQKSTSAYEIPFLMVLASDSKSPATGKSPTVTIKKNGGSFASPAGAVTEDANGWYHIAGNATDSNTLGPLLLHASEGSSDNTDMLFEVVIDDLTTSALRPVTAGRALVVDAAGLADANVVKLGPTGAGTAQTARDIGTSVLISSGAGTGQLDVTAGVVKANLAQILATALTETSGQIAAAFKKFFNIAAPAATMDHGVLVDTVTTYTGNTPQTGDTYARVGAAGAGLTALGDTRIANLDATISSRTKPADTQAAVTLVTTVTNLTNAPTAGDLTAAMKASVNAEADTALADYDAPTHTELTAELATADDAVLAAIAALNNLSSAGAQAAAAAALAAYSAAAVGDIPTAGENATALLVAAAAAPIAANVKEVNDVEITGDGDATPWGPGT